MYDYKKGKERVVEILTNELDVEEIDELPADENLTYSNAYKSWVTGIFVDIRDSTSLFTKENKKDVSRVIRAFTSEVLEILRDKSNLREIGIRGDCIYAVYTTPRKNQINQIMTDAAYINSLLKMLNKLFREKDLPEIKAGIGISSAQELVVKAGRKGTGLNNKVWIGDAVTKSANFSGLGNKNGNKPIIISSCTYLNIKDAEIHPDWFSQKKDNILGTYYDCDIIIIDFNNWINEGMK